VSHLYGNLMKKEQWSYFHAAGFKTSSLKICVSVGQGLCWNILHTGTCFRPRNINANHRIRGVRSTNT